MNDTTPRDQDGTVIEPGMTLLFAVKQGGAGNGATIRRGVVERIEEEGTHRGYGYWTRRLKVRTEGRLMTVDYPANTLVVTEAAHPRDCGRAAGEGSNDMIKQSAPVVITVTKNGAGTYDLVPSFKGIDNIWYESRGVEEAHKYAIVGNMVRNFTSLGFPWVQVEFGKQDVEVQQ